MNLQDTYTDITEIGSGGGGTVFRAFQTRMEKYVVLKKIHDSIRDNVDIQGELKILRNLRHEYLPTVHDFIQDQGSVYTVMDYIPGESFESLLSRGVRFTQAQVEKYAAQLGRVLTYLHGQTPPIVHGDIKPANLMLTPEDNICLIDFNISQLQDGMMNRNMGYTPGYAPPEQVRIVLAMQQYYAGTASPQDGSTGGTTPPGTENAPGQQCAPPVITDRMDVRSDIYSAGATLYAIFSGTAPDADFSQITPIEKLRHNCPGGLANLIHVSMQYYPDDRFQSAAEFAGAVADIPKMDGRYRRLVMFQYLAAAGCILGMVACFLLAGKGRERMGMEREQAASYHVLIGRMEDLREEGGQAEKLEELYRKAVDVLPEEADAYYQKAAGLYENRDYEELERFIRKEVLDHLGSFSDKEAATFYFLLANACLELDDTDSALSYYRTAVKYDAHDSTYYSDYAIALARSGDLEKAQEVLASAEKMGAVNDRILLARGEIAARQGDLEAAADSFIQCLVETKDAYVTLRTYVMWGKIYDEDPDEEKLLQKAAVLTMGLEAVEDADRAVLLEQLAQSYIDLGALTLDNDYNMQAISCLQQIVGRGWDSYVTHNNIGILYQAVGDYEQARKEFMNMLNLYGGDYRTYKRLAFLETKIQMERDRLDRDYSLFADYYDKAGQLFADSNVQADSDMEMKMLEQAYEELREGGWLD